VSDEITARTGEAATPDQLARVMGVTRDEIDKLTDDVHRATVLHYDAMFVDVDDNPMASSHCDDTLDGLLQREQIGYLRDAVVTLPERLRKVVVEYFFEERQMQDIAVDLGVTESRVSQMRAEALVLLRAGLQSALDADQAPGEPPVGRAAKRTNAYMAEMAAASTYKMRISADAPSVEARVAMTA
jgi:RNA polymerase sigma factor for flagellar operon FliA